MSYKHHISQARGWSPLLPTLVLLMLACQSSFTYYPERTISNTPEEIGLKYDSIYFQTSDKIKLHGWFVPADKERGIVLHCHGNAGNISHCLYMIRIWNRLNMSTFVFDYRGFGLSEGNPHESGTYKDAEAAWRYLTGTRNIPPNKIIIHGRSLGGSIAAWLAQKHHPKILIIESSFTTIRDVAEKHFQGSPLLSILTYKYNSIDFIKNAACPVILIHSRDDELIPFELGKKLYDTAGNPKEFIEISGSHNDGVFQSQKYYEQKLDEYITKYLTHRY
jgi:uncharacterized protein